MDCASCSQNENRSDVERWGNHISKVLNSPTARRKFRTYLLDMKLEEAESTVYFWELVDETLWLLRSGNLPRNKMLCRYRKIYNYADDNINFDVAEMTCLRRLLSCSVDEEAEQLLTRVKESVQRLLFNEYQDFSSHLWTKVGCPH